MKPERATRVLIRSLYPGHEKLIDRGLAEQPAFVELCEDYRRCQMALEDHRQSGTDGHPELVREYEELLVELGREIDGWLERLAEARSRY